MRHAAHAAGRAGQGPVLPHLGAAGVVHIKVGAVAEVDTAEGHLRERGGQGAERNTVKRNACNCCGASAASGNGSAGAIRIGARGEVRGRLAC